MKFIKTIFFILVSSQNLVAQNDEPINTDRPDQTEGVYTLSKKHFQIENGVKLSKGSTLNNLLLRYGLFNGTEVRALIDYGKVDELNGFLPVMLSIKQRIIPQNKSIPAVSIIGSVGSEKIASKDFSGNRVPVDLLVAFENELSDNSTLGYNVGTTFNNDFKYSFSFEYCPIDTLALFLEYFSQLERNSNPSHNIDAGVLYLITERIQVDCALGTGILGTKDAEFVTFGISYRFKNKVSN